MGLTCLKKDLGYLYFSGKGTLPFCHRPQCSSYLGSSLAGTAAEQGPRAHPSARPPTLGSWWEGCCESLQQEPAQEGQ
ncbi:hypothetical protein CCHR01_15893 [Colletotrichum chrysophilum]|uniref:Uncharacterized protein n=1 Tax=Colletotrichum chrysophilum TaxID=1836956 RepID=A0AAD9EAJ0_9PEZI|nr:hypothetical protein CCHR01_15893 [Colletotrichum chrysophilum]